jgi:hypothetical protein
VTITICTDDGIDFVKTDRSATSAACAIKNLVKRWSISLFDEQLQEVFLERLMRGSRSLSQDRVGSFRHSFDLDARHGAIMAPLAPQCKQSV